MSKRYLFFVSVAYSYPILRPLQEEILRRGDEVAWFVEPTCPVLVQPGEVLLSSIQSVMAYKPIAIFAPGNYIYDFFPGVKVSLFHGYPINKRGDARDDHFSIRGWFDLYCTQGPTSTIPFKQLEDKYGYFKVYETGWCKADTYYHERLRSQSSTDEDSKRPVVLYSTTFSKGISSASHLFDEISRLARRGDWDWVLSFHPKFSNSKLLQAYRQLAAECPNVTFHEGGIVDARLLNQADVLLSDASSVMVEFMMLDKPVVTYCNTMPGEHLLNMTVPSQVEAALKQAMTRPEPLMNAIRNYLGQNEAHLDGQASARVLDAVDNYLQYYAGSLCRKPWNLLRKFKLRWRVGYPMVSHLGLW